MKDLILGEIKKVFSQKFVIILAALLLLVNIFNCYYQIVTSSDYWYLKKINGEIYALAEGEIKEGSADRLYAYRDEIQSALDNNIKVKTYSVNKDTELMNIGNVIDSLNTFKGYSSLISEVKRNTTSQAETLKNKENTYLLKLNEKIDRTYGEREITKFYCRDGLREALSYDISSVVILLLVILACSSSFAHEKETQMNGLLLSCENGRKKLSFAKKISCISFAVCTGAVFYLTDLIMFMITIGYKGFLLPLYAVEGYEYTPLTMSVFSFMSLSAVIKIFGFIIIAMLTCVFSSILDKSFAVFASSLISVIALMGIGTFADESFSLLSLINPIKLLSNRSMFKTFDVIRLFGSPVGRFPVTFVLALVLLILLSIAIRLLNNKGQRRAKK